MRGGALGLAIVIGSGCSQILGIADRLIMLDGSTRGIIAEGVPADLAKGPAGAKVVEFLTRRSIRTV